MEILELLAYAQDAAHQESGSMAFPAVGVSNAVFRLDLPIDTTPATAGFDVIMQFSQAFVSNQFRDSVASQVYKLTKYYTYDSTRLSSRIVSEIDQLAATLNAAHPGTTYAPSKFVVSLTSPKVELNPYDPDIKVIVTWQLAVTIALATGKPDLPGFELEERRLAFGTVTTRPYIALVTDDSMSQVRAELDFTYSQPKIFGEFELLKELLRGFLPNVDLITAVTEVVALLKINRPRITPQMSIGGSMLPGQQLPFVDKFVVQWVIGHYQKGATLSLCANLFSSSPQGSVTLVPAMVEGCNFAYYATEQTARAVVFYEWDRKQTLKEFVGETKVPLQDPNNEDAVVWGRARVHWTWKTLQDAYIPPSPGTRGALRIKAEGELTILQLWNEQNDEVKQDDQPDLFKPSSQPYAMDYLLFDKASAPSQDEAALQGSQLVKPLYSPTSSDLTLKVIDAGFASSVVKGILIQGDLTTERL